MYPKYTNKMNTKLIVGIVVVVFTLAIIGTSLGLYYEYDAPVPRTPWPLTNIVPGKAPPVVTSWPVRDYALVDSKPVNAVFSQALINGDFVVLRGVDRAVLYYLGTNLGGVAVSPTDKLALDAEFLMVGKTIHRFDDTGFTTSVDLPGSYNIQNVFASDGYTYVADKISSAGRVWIFDEDMNPAGLAQLVNRDSSFGKAVAADPEQELLFVAADTAVYQFAYDPITSFYSALTDHVIRINADALVFAAPALVTYDSRGFRVYRPGDDNIYALSCYQIVNGLVALAVSSRGEMVAASTNSEVTLYYLGPDAIRDSKTIPIAAVTALFIGDDAEVTMVNVNQITRYGPVNGIPSS